MQEQAAKGTAPTTAPLSESAASYMEQHAAQSSPVEHAISAPNNRLLCDDPSVLAGLEELMYNPPQPLDSPKYVDMLPPLFIAASAERGLNVGQAHATGTLNT